MLPESSFQRRRVSQYLLKLALVNLKPEPVISELRKARGWAIAFSKTGFRAIEPFSRFDTPKQITTRDTSKQGYFAN